MQSIKLLTMNYTAIIICIVLAPYTSARFIEDYTSDFIDWYPKPSEDAAPISPEFSWLYLQKNNKHVAYSSIESLFLLADYTMKDVMSQTAFYLYTKKNRMHPQKLLIKDLGSIQNSYWDPSMPTRIIVHGFVANYTDDYVQRMKERFLDLDETNNVIAFDWGPIANLLYPSAASLTDKVGEACSALIDILCTFGAQPNQFHLIGHSLGAHVAGFAAKFTTVGKVGRVTGLDPAYPGFITEGKDGRLDSSDAEFVDCIHTCGGLVAFKGPICHADYYPNGGSSPQPGCTGFFESTGCSHSRAHDLFIESIIEGHQFPALSCPDIPDTEPVRCTKEGARMGYPAESKFEGIFYVVTNKQFPYAPIASC